MKAKPKPGPAVDGTLIWKQFEDLLVPRLRLSLSERAVYSHLVRHTRLEGRRRMAYSLLRVGKCIGLSNDPVRRAVRSLEGKRVLRILERSKAGHAFEVFLPEEIPGVFRARSVSSLKPVPPPLGFDMETADFLRSKELKDSLHERDGGQCFYCYRELTERWRCLDHVVPLARRGLNSYRNLVSSCMECNTRKGEKRAEEFLRELYRIRRLNGCELAERLRMLEKLKAGKLKPALVAPTKPLRRKPRPRMCPAA